MSQTSDPQSQAFIDRAGGVLLGGLQRWIDSEFITQEVRYVDDNPRGSDPGTQSRATVTGNGAMVDELRNVNPWLIGLGVVSVVALVVAIK